MTLQSAFKSATGLEIEEGIKKAIEGKWKGKDATFGFFEPKFNDVGWYLGDGYFGNERVEAILLDPSFWKCLGVTEGWGKRSECCDAEISRYPKDTPQGNGSILPIWFDWCKKCKEKCRIKGTGGWKVKMHLFVDRLAEEGE